MAEGASSRFTASSAKLKAGLNAKIERYKADVAGLEREKRMTEANAEGSKAIALAITMKEGKAELEHCRREYSAA